MHTFKATMIKNWWSKVSSSILLLLVVVMLIVGVIVALLPQPTKAIEEDFSGLRVILSVPATLRANASQSFTLSVYNSTTDTIETVRVIIVSPSFQLFPEEGTTNSITFFNLPPGGVSTSEILFSVPDTNRRTVNFEIRAEVSYKDNPALKEYSFQYSSQVESPLSAFLKKTIALVGAFIVTAVYISQFSKTSFLFGGREKSEELEKRAEAAEQRASEEPAKIKPVWDVARYRLESYIEKNLGQVELIYRLSVLVTFMGFLLIVIGIIFLWVSPIAVVSAAVISGAGVLTEFIGATFLLIYRAILEQARHYLKTLERINTVGMAIQILDSMPEKIQRGDWKNKTKAEITKLIISNLPLSDEEISKQEK